MSDQQFFVMKEDLVKIINNAGHEKPSGKDLLGFVLRPATGVDGKKTYFPNALFSDRPRPTGDSTIDIINIASETPVCPYPPGYPTGNNNNAK